jgi:hypothetical protein
MSMRSPKQPAAPPPLPPPPNPNDDVSRAAAERELRSGKRGRRTVSLTALAGGRPGMSAAPSMLPGRATVTGG